MANFSGTKERRRYIMMTFVLLVNRNAQESLTCEKKSRRTSDVGYFSLLMNHPRTFCVLW